jgi:hypothetical protein
VAQRKYPCVFYNVGPIGKDGRRPDDLERELHGFLRASPTTVLIFLCETLGWGELPGLPGMDKIRDASVAGRANISAYVSRSLRFEPGSETWYDREIQWERTEHDSANEAIDNHPARSDLKFYADGHMWGGAHQPPRGLHSIHPPHDWITDEAQQEGIDLWERQMAPWTDEKTWKDRATGSKQRAKKRMRTLFWDPNRDPNAPLNVPGPNMLANKIDGKKAGTSIEGCVIRKGDLVRPRKQAVIGGVKMGSDHNGAFMVTVVGPAA